MRAHRETVQVRAVVLAVADTGPVGDLGAVHSSVRVVVVVFVVVVF
jgi:hypothetical protein